MAGHGGESLGIFFINGILSAEVHQRGKVVRRWENPSPVMEEEELDKMLSSIPSRMEYRGYKVSMIIAAPPVEYHILSVPAMKKKELTQFCKWKATALKEGSHAWSYTRLKGTRQKGNICLHLIPAVYQSIFIGFCKKNKLEPQHLLTIAAVASGLLQKPDESDGKVEMVALATDRLTYFVIGTKNAPLFIREIPFSWISADQNGLLQFGREIKRTMLFINRQYNKEIGIIRIRGRDTAKAADVFTEIEAIKPQFDETDTGLFESVFATTCYRPDNLLPFDMLGSRVRVRRTLFLAIVLVFFSCALLGMTVFTSYLSRSRTALLAQSDVRNKLALMRDTLVQYEARRAEIEADRLTARHIAQERIAPLPAFVTGYIADLVPREVIVSRMVIAYNRETLKWDVELEGIGPADPLAAADRLERFERILNEKPLSMISVEPWQVQWLANLKDGGGNPSDQYSRRFRITGRLQ